MGLFSSSPADAASHADAGADPVMETLAPRILYSADAAALVAPVAFGESAHAQWQQPAAEHNQEVQVQQPSALVVIDESIEDTDTLLSFLAAEQRRGVQLDWLTIDEHTDGIAAVADELETGEKQYDSIHVFSHGSDAQFLLGTAVFDQSTIDTHAQAFADWQFGLKGEADILLYACDFSASEQGKALAENLAVMTGADIASSSNTTGHSALGGDWELEEKTGAVEAPALVSPQISTSWLSTLSVTPATAEISVPADTSENDVLTNRVGGRQVASNGTVTVVVWERGDDVFFRRFQIDGTPLDVTDQQIENTNNHKNKNPTVAVASNGDFAIAYVSDNGSGDIAIFGQVFNADGSPKPRPADAFGGVYANPNEFRINTTTPDDQILPAIVFRPNDTFAVTWTSPFTIPFVGTSDGVAYSLHNLDGTFIRNERVVSAGVGTNEFNSAVASHPLNASMMIVFEQDLSDDRIQARRILADGSPQNSFINMEATGRNLSNPSVAIAPNGVTYITTVADEDDILLWIVGQNNTLLTSDPIQVNDVSGGKLLNAQVSVQSNNSIVVIWETDQGPDNDEVAIRQYDGAGNPVAPASFVNTDTDGHQHRPSLALTGNTAIVVWSGDSATDNDGVFLRQLSVSEPGVRVTQSGTMTTEAGGVVTLAVRLETRPTGTVTINVGSSDGSEGAASPTTLTFNASNWDSEQDVTITGVDDLIVDGDVDYTITLSASGSDAVYDSLPDTLIDLTNADDDVPATFPVGPVTDNDPAASAVAENSPAGIRVGITAFADDPDAGDNVTYAITGPSAAFFEIDLTSGVVTTSTTPLDYETSTSHVITVIATSSDTSTNQEDFTISVLDENDNPPVISAGQTFAITENNANTSVVGTPIASDADATTVLQNWTITGGTGAAIFDIDAASGEITVIDQSALDFESTPSLGLNLTVSDGVNTSAVQTITISLLDVNEAPLGANASSGGTEDTDLPLVSTGFVLNDPDTGDTLSGIEVRALPSVGTLLFAGTALDSGTPLPLLITTAELDNGDLIYRPPANVNGTNATSFDIAVVDQAGERSVTRTQSIDLTAVDDPPIISSYGGAATVSIDVAENTTSVGAVNAADADGELIQYTGSGVDAAFFSVDPNTGAVQFLSAPDFETPQDIDSDNRYEITVVASDPGSNTASQALTVNVTNQNDVAPVITAGQSFDVSEDATNGTPVNTPAVTDTDGPGTFTNWTITGGTGSGAFSIDSSNGLISVSNASLLNFESANTLTLLITVSDGANASADQTVTINLTDVNEAPLGANATSNGTEDTDLPLTSTAFVFNDPDAGDVLLGIDVRSLPGVGTLLLNGAALNGSTALPQFVTTAQLDNGDLVYRPPADLNGLNVASFDLAVVDQAGERSVTRTQTISLAATNDPPIISSYGGGAAVTLDVAENTTAVGTVRASDAESELIQYAGTGADAAFFSVDANTGVVSFLAAPDFETPLDSDGDNRYEITVEATDPSNSADTQALTVNVTNLNDVAPVITPGQSFAVQEDATNGTPINTPAVSDADGPSTFSNWTITGGTGSSAFTVDTASGLISVSDASQLDFEATTSLTLLITVSDGINTATAETITINLNDANEAPVSANGTSTATEDTDYVFVLNEFAFTDPDAGDALSAIAITSLPGSGQLVLNGQTLVDSAALPVNVTRAELLAGDLIYRPAPNAAGTALTSFGFIVADGDGAQSAPVTQTINVTAVNDTLSITGSRQGTISAGDQLIFSSALLAATDVEDSANLITYTIQTNPTQGDLFREGVVLSQGDQFSQSDINDGRIRYESRAATDTVDSMSFRVADSGGQTVNGVTVSVTALGSVVEQPPPENRAPTPPPTSSEPTDTGTDSNETSDEEDQKNNSSVQVSPPPLFNPSTNNSDNNIASLSIDENQNTLQGASGRSQREVLSAGRWLASGHFGSDLARDLGGTGLEIFGLNSTLSRPEFERLATALLSNDFERMRDSLGDDFARQLQFDKTVVASSVAVSTSLSIGYVLWLLRSGALLSSVLASIPAWRVIDPLPILASMPNRDDNPHDKSLEQMVDREESVTDIYSEPVTEADEPPAPPKE